MIEVARDTSDYDEDLFDYESEEDVFDSVFDEEEPEMEEQSTEAPAIEEEEVQIFFRLLNSKSKVKNLLNLLIKRVNICRW